MNTLLLSFTLVLAVAADASISYSKSQIKDIFTVGKECMKTLNIPFDSDIIERVLYHRNVTKDEETMTYLQCGAEKLGWVDEEGNFHQQPAIDFFARNTPRRLVEELINKCSGRNFYVGSSVRERMYNFYICYFAYKKF